MNQLLFLCLNFERSYFRWMQVSVTRLTELEAEKMER